MKNLIFLLLFCIAVFYPTFAHPGSLDANGGHYNRKTGEYHYEGLHTEGHSSNSSSSYYPPSDYISRDSHEHALKRYEDRITELNDRLSQNTTEYLGKISELTEEKSSLLQELTDTKKHRKALVIIVFIILFVSICSITSVCSSKNYTIQRLTEKFSQKTANSDLVTAYEISILKFQNLLYQKESLTSQIEELKKTLPSIPCGYDTDTNGLPKEKDATDWGKTFTVYVSPNGYLIHTRPDCIKTTIKYNIYSVHQAYDGKIPFCKKCRHNYHVPQLSWVKNHHKFKNLNNDYDTFLKNQFIPTAKELQTNHDKCHNLYNKQDYLFRASEIGKKILLLIREYNKIKRHIPTDENLKERNLVK